MQSRPDWLTPEVVLRLDEAIHAFHVRAFGEQLARINRLPLQERRREVAAIYDHARERGVPIDKPALGTTP